MKCDANAALLGHRRLPPADEQPASQPGRLLRWLAVFFFHFAVVVVFVAAAVVVRFPFVPVPRRPSQLHLGALAEVADGAAEVAGSPKKQHRQQPLRPRRRLAGSSQLRLKTNRLLGCLIIRSLARSLCCCSSLAVTSSDGRCCRCNIAALSLSSSSTAAAVATATTRSRCHRFRFFLVLREKSYQQSERPTDRLTDCQTQ